MKKMWKVLLMSFTLFFLVACGADSSSNKEKTIGYAINNLNDTFQTYILEAAKETAKENKIDIKVENAKEDLISQQDQVNTLIQNGVSALIVVPVDTSAMGPITKAAQNAGIPLVYVNRNPYAGKEKEMPKDVYYVGSDEITAGIMQMDYIGEQLNGEGGITVLMGILGNEGAVQRTKGVSDTAAGKFPKNKILAKETGEWQRDKALSIAENWISTYGDDVKAIIANNDEMALGAVQAAKKNGRNDILITGIDAIPDALDAVESGDLATTIFQDAKGQGGGAVDTILAVFDNKPPKEAIKYVPFKLVTPENVAEFK
ncbi:MULTISPECIES: substrate-binding domain-containing protein [Carnobacterium]|uniref:Periplasmic binding s and sugar binding domain of the LacI family protein n=1 Tax=Carnobacterium maltaromaticum LMA28 TaxID=1234679 RepID=K8E592_CARML|nr:substrate-binding domain-containing protein [Carnobacterium maltaromaticum]KRN59998.1 RbsB (ribose ABC transporter) (ribose-binding protein) [Carnobacterium maltaromaticum DSM 20342]CCO11815.2 periplasmic binding s and sugar binding domain of the LacI family protein [Carnobacterium maltaromaticum LMA28]